MTLRDIVLHNKKIEHDCQAAFVAMFGKSLHPFMNIFTGFDIVAFDRWIGTPDGTSLADYLAQEYGQEANDLISKVIG